MRPPQSGGAGGSPPLETSGAAQIHADSSAPSRKPKLARKISTFSRAKISLDRLPMLQRLVVDPAKIHPPTIQLTPEQQHYLTRVLRLQIGDRFIAMNGQGESWLTILDDGPTATLVHPINTQTELPIAVTLVMALPKGNGFDEVVRQATELGVSQIQPVISDRTLLNPSPQKLERWRRIAQEAAEQSERQIVPALLDPITFVDHLHQIQSSQPHRSYLCTPRRAAPALLPLLTQTWQAQPLTIAIGPEGGWTDPELDQAIAAGYALVSLGDRILRAVTAPIVALALIAASCEPEPPDESET
ncbi:MAG: 16S rRNA (uracil(1498)-N(3))-methyltransferase [Leptolyngbyaceae cyanobacterium bins.349]|nr:16S rRNA (uracil(1498)-N(3))-methyltransferase [Leptolyngbyaceae cyanobacterium bins.349]